MKRRSHKPDRRSLRPPPVVVGLLAIELVAAIVLFVVGLSPGEILKSAGPVMMLTLALLNPTFQELGRRQATLSVVAEEADADAFVNASGLRPWPLDEERVVANDVADARETLSAPHRAMNVVLRASNPFMVLPSDDDHVRAREAFEQQLSEFEASMRGWLAEYRAAASARSQTFELTLRLTNPNGGAHAEAVTVVLDLPATISIAEDRPVVPLPPERPSYEPPRPHSIEPVRPVPLGVPLSPRARPMDVPPSSFGKPAWKVTADGARLETSVGDVHSGRSVSIGEPLLLRADGAGRHEIGWTVFTKSARRPIQGTIALVVPSDPERPAFGRLHGVTSYPDVPIVGDDDEVVHPVRRADPPLRPPVGEDADDTFERLQQASAVWEWNAFGLDPATDGPDRSVVRVARSAADDAPD